MSDDNPFVGSGMHQSGKERDLTGRALRRAEARGYREPTPQPKKKPRKKKGKK